MAEVRLLGVVELRAVERVLDLGPPKQRAVFAALAVDAGRPVGVDTLVDRVWGGAPPAEARNALYAHIMRIRRLLARAAEVDGSGPRLGRGPGGYVLDIDLDHVDLHRFERLVDQARGDGQEDSQRVVLLREALALWRAAPMADLSGAWFARRREAWRQQWLNTLVAWARTELCLGNHEAVIDRLHDIVVDHPLVEPLAGLMMQALHAAGRDAEALEHYATIRRRLVEQLGTDPGPDLQQLYQAILRGETHPGPHQPQQPQQRVPAGRTDRQVPVPPQMFTGRAGELAALGQIHDAAAVVISAIDGMASVGKVLHPDPLVSGGRQVLAGRRPELGDGIPERDRLSIGVLGPFEVSLAGRPVTLTAPRLRALLAALAVWAPDPVPVDRLTSAVWNEDVPESPRKALQLYITRLRRLLGAGFIVTCPGAYALEIEPGRVDALRFSRLLDGLAAASDAAAERALLAEALRLWRGTPFEDVQSVQLAKSVGSPLLERYLTAVERRADLAVGESDNGDFMPLLDELVSRYPLRESLWVRLLVARARSGRPAEALDLYEMVRRRLADELGTDPGPELRQVHADLLAGRSPATTGSRRETADGRVPRQLPTDIAGFTGRDEELSALDQMLPADVGTVRIYAISGSAGVGKSALAIRAAHRLSGWFPDGQLYVNLQGATAGLQPLAPLDVLGRFLRALGADAASVPADVEEAGALFRSAVASRRLLIVLDNAAESAQVRPLLPATLGCAVLVTSRRMLPDLLGARHLPLDVLDAADALTLLGRTAGPTRIDEEPEAAREVARWCGNLPLALRIAGARLAARPTWSVAALAERLADTQRRLDELELGEVGVRASFAVSHQQLADSTDPVDRAAAQVFGLIGVLDGPDVSTLVASRLLDLSHAQTERGLERLVDAHLLETPVPGRYRLHDLLRLYARERVAEYHPDSLCSSALTRVLGFYVATAWQTLRLLRPGDYRLDRADGRWLTGGLEFPDKLAALEWLDAERANLLAAVQQSATDPDVPSELAIQLTQALFGYLSVRCYWEDRVQLNQTVLAVATRLNDPAAQGQALIDLGLSRFRQGRYDEAAADHRQALAIFRRLGDRQGLAASAGGLGFTLERLGRHDQALVYLQESLAMNQELGDRRGLATALSNLGETYLRLNRPDEALDCLLESLAIDRELEDRWGESIDLLNLGKVNERLGRYDDALACYQDGLAINREADDPDGVAHCLCGLGAVHRRQGRHELALGCHRESLAIQRELGDPYCLAESLRELGLTLQATGCVEEAGQHLREALSIFEQLRSGDADEIRALLAKQQITA